MLRYRLRISLPSGMTWAQFAAIPETDLAGTLLRG